MGAEIYRNFLSKINTPYNYTVCKSYKFAHETKVGLWMKNLNNVK